MMTMGDDGERTCPLCAEDMDLTDQQLKPCKCGYEICVWCWHQINDMAEKEDAEGRCPACRTPYDKERVVKMAAKCERLVAEVNTEKKQRSQKAKIKTSVEAKKHLSSVRVVQRNLVYIIGVPSNLCDESILERKEYFGQYGKVIKVSISRSASGPSQQTPTNGTFSVYVTYAREEEAVRCIQAVHNYVLEGKTLRACFGTTKYCHAWLRNMTCSNPDCLYLHDVGSQEDSFTKDEVISAYTRSRVPQMSSNNSLRRSGNVLPPPAEDFSSNIISSGRNHVKGPSNNALTQVKGSPNSSSGKSTVLPSAASWGLRSSSCRSPIASAAASQVPHVKQKVEMVGNFCLPPMLTESMKYPSAWNDEMVTASNIPETQISASEKLPSFIMESEKHSLWHNVIDMSHMTSEVPVSKEAVQSCGLSQPIELSSLSLGTVGASNFSSRLSWNSDIVITSKLDGKKPMTNSDEGLENQRPAIDRQSQTSSLDVSTIDVLEVSEGTCTSQLPSNTLHDLPVSGLEDKEVSNYVNDEDTISANSTIPKCFDRGFGTEGSSSINSATNNLCSILSSVSIDSHDRLDHPNANEHQFSDSDCFAAEMSLSNDSDSVPLSKDLLSVDECDQNVFWEQGSQPLEEKNSSAINSKGGALRACDTKVLPYVVDNLPSLPYPNQSHNSDNNSGSTSDSPEMESFHLRYKKSTLYNGHKEDEQSSYSARMAFNCTEMICNEEKSKSLVRDDGIVTNNKYATVDLKRENNIISDILSLDVNPWDDSLTTVNSFARLLGETETQENSLKLLNSWKSNNSNQSRFSFARQETQGNPIQPTKHEAYAHMFSSSNGSYGDGIQNGILFNASGTCNNVINGVIPSDNAASTSKAKISAPPGFSAPNKAPPPGFSSQDRFTQTHQTSFSESHMLGSPVGNHYQAHLPGSSADVEFIDPAILAVGKGRMPMGISNSNLGFKSTFPMQISSSDQRLNILKQQSLSSYQNLGIPDPVRDRFMPMGDAYITSYPAENHSSLPPIAQMSFQQWKNTQFLSKQWDGSNGLWTGTDMGMSEVLRNENFGHKLYSSNEEQKLGFPNGDLFNREFRM
ncbi:hypothetical protein Cni_G13093 [Canna indica]|uniref:CCR4-NOT transcription complex subunit 4 n=1 Tax=Canna indica TaxID=4628 RepID=A0AAQ3K8Z3_9LILI|nr:hypothetical protein Cni_G13093 [Canna indica]